MSHAAHLQARVIVFNLKIYEQHADYLIIGVPGLRWPPYPFGHEPRPSQIPRLMIEEIVMTSDQTRVAYAIMERWVAEKNGFDFMEIRNDASLEQRLQLLREGFSPTDSL